MIHYPRVRKSEHKKIALNVEVKEMKKWQTIIEKNVFPIRP